MRTIWKFPVPYNKAMYDGLMVDGTFRFALMAPEFCLPMHFEARDGAPFLWAEVYDDGKLRSNRMVVVATGVEIPKDAFMHIGTWRDGAFVWHLFHCYDEDGTYQRDRPRPPQ